MKKVLMVCLGNICRSPLAEGILKKKASNNIEIDSAGTASYHIGEHPDLRAIKIAKKNGVDISNLRARQFSKSDFETFDYIFVMDQNNYNNIIRLAEKQTDIKKVTLILNNSLDVPDPYYGGEDGFQEVYNLLNEACDKIIKKIH